MTQILQWAPFRIETACWQNRRPTHMCSEPVEGWHVATRGNFNKFKTVKNNKRKNFNTFLRR